MSDMKWLWWLVAGIALVALATFVIPIFRSVPVLDSLRDQEYARGLITFLISLGTILLAFILVLSGLFSGADEEKFRRSREVFAALMGILGTIVGFYFGSGIEEPTELSVSEIRILAADSEAELVAYISGGRPPYRYTITFEDSDRAPIEERVTSSGWVQEHLSDPVPPSATIEVTDRDDRSAVGRTARDEGGARQAVGENVGSQTR